MFDRTGHGFVLLQDGISKHNAVMQDRYLLFAKYTMLRQMIMQVTA